MLAAGGMAPEFSLRDLDGGTRELRGSLLVFFKISCPTCQLTLPFIQRLAGHVPILGISQDDEESTREFLDYFRIAFPVAIDPVADRYNISIAYGLTNVPSLFLIGKDGTISWALNGFHRAELQGLAERLGTTIFRAGERVPILKPG